VGWDKVKTALAFFVIFSLVIVPLIASENQTLPVWKVEQDDKFHYRIRFGQYPRSLDFNQRWFDVDERIYMEIFDLGNLTEDSIWVPITMNLCRVRYFFQNGTQLPNSGVFSEAYAILSRTVGPIPVGNWSEASQFVIDRNQVFTNNRSYEIIDDSESWGFVLHDPDLNMTDTRIWSKEDGSLKQVTIQNGITERLPAAIALDLYLESIEPSAFPIILAIGPIAIVALVAIIYIFKNRSSKIDSVL
jgi:hypothetical protein